MQWHITNPPAIQPVTLADAMDQIGLDDYSHKNKLTRFIEAATRYAEDETQLSLITRTMQSAYYPERANQLPSANPLPPYSTYPIFRGPVQSIISVTDAAGHAVPYGLRRVGTVDFVQINSTVIAPLTITYTAGYGDTAASVPAAIRGAILCHVAHLFRFREADEESIPVGLDRVYSKYRAGGAA